MKGSKEHFSLGFSLRRLPAVLAGLVCLVGPTRLLGGTTEGKRDMLSYRIELGYEAYVAGQTVPLLLTLTHQDTAAIELPDPSRFPAEQPTYRLTGPAFEEGRTFSYRSAFSDRADPAATASEPIRIEPGEIWQGRVALDSLTDLSLPGAYRVESSLNWQDRVISSAPVEFTIEPLQAQSISAGFGPIPNTGSCEGECAFLQHGHGAPRMMVFRFTEKRPDIREISQYRMATRAAVGSEAAETACPRTTTSWGQADTHWVVWRKGRFLCGLIDSEQTPYQVELPTGPLSLVRPPLQTPDGCVDSLALEQDHHTLSLVRFRKAFLDKSQGARLLWTVPLPARPQAITAAAAPPGGEDTRHVGFVVQNAHGIKMYHSRYHRDGALEPFQSVEIPHVRLVPHSDPALTVSGNGVAKLSVLIIRNPDMHTVGAVETIFRSGGIKPETSTLSAGQLAAAPLGGAILYAEDEKGITTRMAAFVCHDNEVLIWREGHSLLPSLTKGRPITPLILIPGKQAAYLVYPDSERGLAVEPAG